MDLKIKDIKGFAGLFQGNYTWDSWIKEFKTRRGLKIYIYKVK